MQHIFYWERETKQQSRNTSHFLTNKGSPQGEKHEHNPGCFTPEFSRGEYSQGAAWDGL